MEWNGKSASEGEIVVCCWRKSSDDKLKWPCFWALESLRMCSIFFVRFRLSENNETQLFTHTTHDCQLNKKLIFHFLLCFLHVFACLPASLFNSSTGSQICCRLKSRSIKKRAASAAAKRTTATLTLDDAHVLLLFVVFPCNNFDTCFNELWEGETGIVLHFELF